MIRFYVIYDFEIPQDKSVNQFKPTKGKWTLTEKSNSFDSSFFNPDGDDDGMKAKQRKYVGEVSREELNSLIEEQCLSIDHCDTGGSLTFEGLLPALSFSERDGDAYQNAYVTPIFESKEPLTERHWKMVKCAMFNVYD